MAPEIVTGEKYGFETDFWAAAICIYEFVCGMVPFGESSVDSMEIYNEIIKGYIIFNMQRYKISKLCQKQRFYFYD